MTTGARHPHATEAFAAVLSDMGEKALAMRAIPVVVGKDSEELLFTVLIGLYHAMIASAGALRFAGRAGESDAGRCAELEDTYESMGDHILTASAKANRHFMRKTRGRSLDRPTGKKQTPLSMELIAVELSDMREKALAMHGTPVATGTSAGDRLVSAVLLCAYETLEASVRAVRLAGAAGINLGEERGELDIAYQVMGFQVQSVSAKIGARGR